MENKKEKEKNSQCQEKEKEEMKMELCNCMNYILGEIADKQFKRDHIALTYCLVLQQKTEKIDWAKINRAVMDRWSKAGLVYIKELAWKIYHGKMELNHETGKFERVKKQ